MSCSLHVVKTDEFVRMTAEGRFDLDGSKRVLANIAQTCMDRDVNCALLDIRGAERSLSTEDLYRLAQSFQEAGFSQHQRVAILHRYNAAERAEMFAMLASAKGWHVRAFDNYEEAMEWFTSAAVMLQ